MVFVVAQSCFAFEVTVMALKCVLVGSEGICIEEGEQEGTCLLPPLGSYPGKSGTYPSDFENIRAT